jgi:(1->4)-alpha-D-glucan 1-alpha-D-glucosylmutase
MPADGTPTRRATYRLQLRPEFGFAAAAEIADYLADLGASHLYLSPILQAASGSTHGYDVVDPTRISADLGGESAYRQMTATAAAAGLRQLVDTVPNHMAVTGRDNVWWWDVLEDGPASIYAPFFDVDWNPPEAKLRNVVLLPILGDHYGRELEAGRLRLEREGGSCVVRYYEHAAPISPRTLGDIVAGAVDELTEAGEPGVDRGTVDLVASTATALGRLPEATSAEPGASAERHRDKRILRARLAEMCELHPPVAAAVDRAIEAVNDDVEALDRLLERQNYRLAWWRTAGEELDYRRFFDINDLAAIRVEDPLVFAETHRRTLGLIEDGSVDGLRIDHVDGLRDPAAYLSRLQAAAPGTWVVVEKILEGHEALPVAWPVAGTSGYEWLNLAGGAFTHPGGAADLVDAYQRFSGVTERYEEIVHECKVEILEGGLAADLSRLAERLTAICERHRRQRDYTRRDLRAALGALLAGFSVYRTYGRPGEPASEGDVEVVDAAVRAAGLRHPELDEELLDFVRDLLLGRVPGREEAELAARFQQLSGPVMAKAVEDTAFYRYLPCTWLNEVGGDPGRLGVDLDELHRANASAQQLHPEGLLALTTHDTKRSEDVRARLSVLAEVAPAFEAAALRWRDHHRAKRACAPPDGNTEWLAYQTMVGAWPISADRLVEYLSKATREAKVNTSWTSPDPFYDEQLEQWVREALDDADFTGDLVAFIDGIARPGWAVGLGLKLATLTAPGIPDLYQGTEVWDLSLVDPDNRRAVDYGRRRDLLERAAQVTAAEAWAEEAGSGLTKLAVVRAALAVRRQHPSWFGPGGAGAYAPLRAEGAAAGHCVAWQRGSGAITVLTRWPQRLVAAGGWQDTVLRLPPGTWRDHLAGGARWEGEVSVAALLAGLPVGLLVAEAP